MLMGNIQWTVQDSGKRKEFRENLCLATRN